MTPKILRSYFNFEIETSFFMPFFSISYDFHSNQIDAVARGFLTKSHSSVFEFLLFNSLLGLFTTICSFVSFHMTEWPCTTTKLNISKLRWPAPVSSAVCVMRVKSSLAYFGMGFIMFI